MNNKIDTGGEILYNEQIERMINLVAEKAAEKILSVLANLDNETAHRLSFAAKATLTVNEAACVIGVSKPTMYSLIRKSGFPAVHIGRKVLICRDALLRWLEGEADYGKKTSKR